MAVWGGVVGGGYYQSEFWKSGLVEMCAREKEQEEEVERGGEKVGELGAKVTGKGDYG